MTIRIRLHRLRHAGLLDLRHAVKAITDHGLMSDVLVGATTRVWKCKNKRRPALRADILFLFEESETSASSPSGHQSPDGAVVTARATPSNPV